MKKDRMSFMEEEKVDESKTKTEFGLRWRFAVEKRKSTGKSSHQITLSGFPNQ
jgi:hypothetical protein